MVQTTGRLASISAMALGAASCMARVSCAPARVFRDRDVKAHEPERSTPGLLRGGVAPRNAAERQTFPDIPGALVQVAVNGPEFTRTVEPRYRTAIRPHNLGTGIASGAALRVEHRGRELNRIEGSF